MDTSGSNCHRQADPLDPIHDASPGGVGGAIAKSNGAFFFIWTFLALGVTALFSIVLSALGLWEHLPLGTAAQYKQGVRA
jgi:hypothetical protein